LDYASITPVAPEVLAVMEKHASAANPSALYAEGLEAKDIVEAARSTISSILSAQKKEIYFTASGTEADNLALLGVFEAYKKDFDVPHVIVSSIEHPAILEVCKEIQKRGGEVTFLPVSEEGLVNPADVRKALKDTTVVVSVMYANNEIGTIQPVKEISKIIREWRHANGTALPYLHSDACQAALYLPLDAQKLGVDLLTLDGIKMYGPRGIGMLYVRSGVRIAPILFGGGQENGLRSGTENVAAIAGFATALELAGEKREEESARLLEIREYAIASILNAFPHASLNGSRTERLPSNINICFPGLDAEFAVISLDVAGIACSYSSSCQTLKENSSSYVVEALGHPGCALSSLRFTLGRETVRSDIDALLSALKKIVK